MPSKEKTIDWKAFGLLILLALALAIDFRIPYLDERPMHTDEAILATKFIDFSQTGHFAYDPRDFHGPALHDVTALAAKAAGWKVPEDLTEFKLRLVVAVTGILLILATLLARDALGSLAAALAMLLMAVSPMMVYFSRYYIMEVLLALWVALFLFSCWRYSQSLRWEWLIAAGIALGLQHATKETFILNCGAAACGWIGARIMCGSFSRRSDGKLSFRPARKQVKHPWVWVAAPAALVSILLFSSFFKDWNAVKDSILTYAHYFDRSGGSGHEKPWNYYISLIFYRKDTVVWSEALIGCLGIVGMANAFFGHHRNGARHAFLVFLTVYTLALFTVYSLIPYKTPWSILSAQHSLTLLAGVGAAEIWRTFKSRIARIVIAVLFLAGLWNLCAQVSLVVHRYAAGPPNPYAYSHTSPRVLELVDTIRKLEALRPEGFSVQVIDLESGWPLPWYLRDMRSAGYQISVPSRIDATIVIAGGRLAPEVESRLPAGKYSASTHFLRPDLPLVVYVETDLWSQYLARNKQTPAP